MGLTRKTAPAAEPVTAAEAKTQCEYTASDRDAYFNDLIKTARGQAETVTGRALITQTWELTYTAWPAEMKIPKGKVTAIASIKYYDTADTETVLDSADYQVDLVSEPARIRPAHGKSWPSITLRSYNAIIVEFACGYADAAALSDDRPEIKHAILLSVASWFAQRENHMVGLPVMKMPTTAHDLLVPHIVPEVGHS